MRDAIDRQNTVDIQSVIASYPEVFFPNTSSSNPLKYAVDNDKLMSTACILELMQCAPLNAWLHTHKPSNVQYHEAEALNYFVDCF